MRRLGLVLLIAIALCAWAMPAASWNEPDGFRDIRWGASQDEVKEKLKIGQPCWSASMCNATITIGPVRGPAILFFRQGGFDEITFSFAAEEFSRLETIAVERYGTPTQRRTVPVQTRAGAEFMNVILEWEGRQSVVELRRYGSSVREGVFRIQTTTGRDERLNRLRQELKRGKDDL